MASLTNQDKIRIIKKYQACPYVHQLTCGQDSMHAVLVPEENQGKVVLRCPTCRVVQEHVPEAVYLSEESLDEYAKKDPRDALKD